MSDVAISKGTFDTGQQPLKRLVNADLTLIVTTSPTPSAPSTKLLSAVFASFQKHCSALLSCRIITVFDTYDHVTAQARLKRGHVTIEQAEAYKSYIRNVKSLIIDYFGASRDYIPCQTVHDAEFGSPGGVENSVLLDVFTSPDTQITFVTPRRRLGFALAVRSALRLASTKYVWVHQHDWILTADIPLVLFLDAMDLSSSQAPISYICLPSIRLLTYAVQHDTLRFPALRNVTAALQGEYPSALFPKIPLTPLFFWHDKPHVADRQHYFNSVFPSRYAMRRGEFIEDTIGQKARDQMKNGQWHKWACWLYYPDDGRTLCVRHLQGRTWTGAKHEQEQGFLPRAST